MIDFFLDNKMEQERCVKVCLHDEMEHVSMGLVHLMDHLMELVHLMDHLMKLVHVNVHFHDVTEWAYLKSHK